MTPLLEVQGVCKRFGVIEALTGVSLRMDEGETVAVIGPSGCGKTTLLRCIARLESIDRGEIRLSGRLLSSGDAASGGRPEAIPECEIRRMVGIVFQQLHLWPHRTVLDNLALAPRLSSAVGRRAVEQEALELLTRLGLADKAYRKPGSLSGGEQQRVAIARTLMVRPQLLLLDEITSALDPELVGDVLDLVADLAAQRMTVLIVTHELAFALEVAGRVVFMDGGEIVEQGPAREVLGTPKTARLSRFIERLSRHRRV